MKSLWISHKWINTFKSNFHPSNGIHPLNPKHQGARISLLNVLHHFMHMPLRPSLQGYRNPEFGPCGHSSDCFTENRCWLRRTLALLPLPAFSFCLPWTWISTADFQTWNAFLFVFSLEHVFSMRLMPFPTELQTLAEVSGSIPFGEGNQEEITFESTLLHPPRWLTPSDQWGPGPKAANQQAGKWPGGEAQWQGT